jgi:hypothetical protein
VDVGRGSIDDGLRHRFDSFCDEGHVANVLLRRTYLSLFLEGSP